MTLQALYVAAMLTLYGVVLLHWYRIILVLVA